MVFGAMSIPAGVNDLIDSVFFFLASIRDT
jgi:hypothetical protein